MKSEINQGELKKKTKPRLRFSLSVWIGLGLISGIFCGLFFGEYCGSLKVVGDAFVGLLQMTVLPYIAVSLIANIGRLTLAESRRLVWLGGLTLAVLWGIVLAIIFILPFTFPEWNSGAFFSTALIENPSESNLLDYFIPANIFKALSANQVPAIVMFCIASGLGLATLDDRQQLISHLDVLSKVLFKVSEFITQAAPVGIFAIAASTAGTISLTEVVRLQSYLIAYTIGAIFLGFIMLPLLVTSTTSLTYRQVLRIAREPMLTAFATGKLIVVLPMLIKNTERLFEEIDEGVSDYEMPAVDVLFATAYPFPHVGKLLSLVFIPFAAWFIGDALSWQEYPAFLGSGVFAYFGGPIIAIPFLLDQMHLPHDMFQLFLLSGVYGERIGDAVGAMHLTTFTLITAMGFRGTLKIRWGIVIKRLAYAGLAGVIMLGAARGWLEHSIDEFELQDRALAQMHLIDEPVENVVFNSSMANPDPLLENETIIERIRRRGTIRIGFNEDEIPFAFFSRRNHLVGYDINMAHELARDLGVTIEFVPFDREMLEQQLEDDHFDLVMSALVGTLERSEVMLHTSSYLDVNLAFVVPDHQARNFRMLDSIRSIRTPRIGFVDLSRGFVERLQKVIPEVELIEIKNNRDYFTGRTETLDALLISAESGSAFTLTYPKFEVVVPRDLSVKLPLFYVVAGQDVQMRDFLEYWISLRRKDGTATELYDYWVLGKIQESKAPRWSIIRDVLHWVE